MSRIESRGHVYNCAEGDGSRTCLPQLDSRFTRACSTEHRLALRVLQSSLSFSAHPPLPPAGVRVDSGRSLGESQGPGTAMGRGAPGCMHPAMWVADFFASGWSGGDNDLTCLEEPWTAAEIWDGEGSQGPDREELGAENAPPPGLA